MESLERVVSGQKLSTLFAKHSILDIWQDTSLQIGFDKSKTKNSQNVGEKFICLWLIMSRNFILMISQKLLENLKMLSWTISTKVLQSFVEI